MYSCGSGCNKALFYILKPCFIYWIQWLALPLTFHTIEREVVNTNPDHLMALFTSTQFMSQHINLLHVHCPKRGCAKLLIPLWKQRRVSSLLVPQHFNLLVFTANSVVWHWHWKQLKHGSHGFVRTWLLCQEAACEPGICAAQEWRSSSQGWEIPLGVLSISSSWQIKGEFQHFSRHLSPGGMVLLGDAAQNDPWDSHRCSLSCQTGCGWVTVLGSTQGCKGV